MRRTITMKEAREIALRASADTDSGLRADREAEAHTKSAIKNVTAVVERDPPRPDGWIQARCVGLRFEYEDGSVEIDNVIPMSDERIRELRNSWPLRPITLEDVLGS